MSVFRLLSARGVVIVVLSLLLVQVTVILCRAIHSLYFHPLRKYPGPKTWIAFPIIKTILQLQGKFDQRIRDCHAKYGPVLRTSSNGLLFTNAEAWKDIYGHGHGELPKLFPPGLDDGSTGNIIRSNPQNHFRFRRAMLPAFSDKALDQQESIIQAYVELLISRLRTTATSQQSTNMVKWYTHTTFDLIGDLAYGVSFDGLKEGKPNRWVENINNMMRLFPVLALISFFPMVSKILLFFVSDKIKNSRKEHLKMTTELAMTRIQNRDMDRRGDFMDFMMRAEGKEHALTHAELAANADTLIVAGSETTATLLCGVTYYLLSNPRTLQICVDEVRSAFENEHDITFKQASTKLPYMLACLDEALRIFPPVPLSLERITLPDQITIIDGHEIPPGITVGVHHLSANHSQANFFDAQTFHPERWLADASTDTSSPFFNDSRDACKPFSTGPRNCIGRNLAYHEMRLILAKVLWNFDMSLSAESSSWAESQRTFALWEKPPLMVSLHERVSSS